jgi:hypothetical protein
LIMFVVDPGIHSQTVSLNLFRRTFSFEHLSQELLAVPRMFPAAYLLGAQIVSWGFSAIRPSCECYCRGDPSEGVLQLLGQQLARCGPEHLARVCPAQAAASWCPGIALLGLLFAAGYVAGLATVVLARQPLAVGAAASAAAASPALESPSRFPLAAPVAAASPERRGPLTPASKRALALCAGNGSSELPHA